MTGALFGLVVCSLVFFGYVALAGPQVMAELPGPLSIAGGNLIAGGAMGGYAKTSSKDKG